MTAGAGPDRAFAASAGAAPLVFVADPSADELAIDGDDGHHLQRVRRIVPGESLVVADGAGAWAPTRVIDACDGRVRVQRVGSVRIEPELTPRLAIAFAPAAGDHAAAVVHALVELGVDRIIPVEARRSVVRWRGERGVRAVARLRRVAREAAMVAHRARVPEVGECAPLGALAGHPAIVIADRSGEPSGELAAPVSGEWLLVVGPEGGFAPGEVEGLGPWTRVSVGVHVLRARTAPVALAAALAGHRRPPDRASGSGSP